MRWWKVGLGLSALPISHLLISAEFDYENTVALLSSIPRTLRAIRWAMNAGYDYYQNQDAQSWTLLHTTWAEELTKLCKQNGGVYVKAAQLASTFGAVPTEYRTQLSHLHDRCSPQSFTRIKKSIEKELGFSYKEEFREIEEEATAAASIAQVHCARLKSGRKVALKVQYPALESSVSADLACLLVLSRLADFVFPRCQLNWIFRRLKREIFDEMDFTIEAKNAQMLRDRLSHRMDIRIPEIIPELCTSRCIAMEWIEGCKLSDKHCLRQMGINPRSVALTLLDAFSEMTLIHGFIHGDPHPGNLLVVPLPLEQRKNWLWRLITFQWRTPFQLVLLDHGRYLQMDQDTRRVYCELWYSLIKGDQARAIKAATSLCHGQKGGHLLPRVLYRPFDKKTRSQLQREATFSDLIGLLKDAPQILVDALRIIAVVRHVAAALADIKFDRAYIEGSHAWDGLYLDQGEWRLEFRVRLRLVFMKISVWLRDASYSWQLFFESL